jgi:hypothetical protein
MALPKFAVYQTSATANTLTEIGTVRDLMGENGGVGYIPSNLKRETKLNGKGETVYNRLVLIVTNGEIDPLTKKPLTISLTCSESLSRDLRAKTVTLSEVADFPILENEDGISFVSNPGTGIVMVQASKLKTTAVSTKAINHQELIAL